MQKKLRSSSKLAIVETAIKVNINGFKEIEIVQKARNGLLSSEEADNEDPFAGCSGSESEAS